MADRITFLNRIREQAAKGRAHHVAINPAATAEAAYVGGGVDPIATLLSEWAAVGGQGMRVANAAAAQEWLKIFLTAGPVRSAIRWDHPLLTRLGLDAVLTKHGVAIYGWGSLAESSTEDRWTTAFAADVGITSVSYAVAETGSLVVCSSRAHGRVCSLLPPVTIAFVEPAQILPDLFDVFATLEGQKRDLPSNLVFITGPSKTGDIELKLTTGVHGPGTVYLVVVEQP
jgi:L-lactate dehydrogenase complex protein LldG